MSEDQLVIGGLVTAQATIMRGISLPRFTGSNWRLKSYPATRGLDNNGVTSPEYLNEIKTAPAKPSILEASGNT